MNNDIKQQIEKYVMEEFKYIKQLDPTDEKYEELKRSSINDINTLIGLLQKEDINDDNVKKDIELRSDRIIKVITDATTIIVPIIFYNAWMNKGFRFEETGTYTSNTFKNLFNKFKPSK